MRDPVYLHHIETLVPGHTFTQAFLCEQMQRWAGTEKERRYIRGIYPASGIETRHFVVSENGTEPTGIYSRDGLEGPPTVPGTEARNAVFAEASREMVVDVARRAIEGCARVNADDVTHVIVVSCTGFYNPGPDYYLVRALGLGGGVQRYCLGFMGCHAALPALRMATQFCHADPEAVVLVVCVELCSLHLQFDGSPDSLVGNALFADGVAAVVVSARTPTDGQPAYRLDGFTSALLAESEKDMAWEIGDRGFRLTLSSYVSRIVGAEIRPVLTPVLGAWNLEVKDVDLWAVHPGGKTILDRIEQELELCPEHLAASRSVLRHHGNMSSATVLFVLKEILGSGVSGRVCALAFGPGVTVEMGNFQLVLGNG
ncbi:MAG: type III polyketide synthase [bacterium]|nr:type III polyketide synthase [bacterium]